MSVCLLDAAFGERTFATFLSLGDVTLFSL